MCTNKKHLLRITALVLLLAMLCGCGAREEAAPAAATIAVTEAPVHTTAAVQETEALPEENKLVVAIYPYMPDVQLFEDILIRQWAELEPDVALEFVDWNCYEDPDASGIDVMTYDALFTTYLAENGYIQPIPYEAIQDVEGFLPFAVEGAYHNDEIYGIPYLVCSYFLIHHSDDEGMCAVENFGDLCEEVAKRKAEDPQTGLLTNFVYDYPYHYLDAYVDFSGEYTVFEEAPSCTPPDAQVLEQIHQMEAALAPEKDTSGSEDPLLFRNGALFNNGYGCVYYGYSEDISFMDDILDDITIRTLSFSENANIQLFYTDIASMGSQVTDPDKQALCIRLMNLIGSEAFLEELCFGTGDAQYMLPARQSVYIQAQEAFPMYGRLYELAMDEQNRIFRFGADIHTYLEQAYENLA